MFDEQFESTHLQLKQKTHHAAHVVSKSTGCRAGNQSHILSYKTSGGGRYECERSRPLCDKYTNHRNDFGTIALQWINYWVRLGNVHKSYCVDWSNSVSGSLMRTNTDFQGAHRKNPQILWLKLIDYTLSNTLNLKPNSAPCDDHYGTFLEAITTTDRRNYNHVVTCVCR